MEEHDGAVERRILAATLMHDRVCAAVASKWNFKGLYRSRWANVVGQWCKDYCDKHNQAPKRHVESLFLAWARNADETTVKLVESFLEGVAGELESDGNEINPDYVIDLAGKYFDEVRVRLAISEAEGLCETGDHEGAWKLLSSLDRVQLSQGRGIDVLRDEPAIESALSTDRQEPLVSYSGALGEFFDVKDCLHRDCLVMFAGPKGRGKSAVLLDLAWRLMENRKRVAFFALGDMSQDQMMRRFISRAARRPVRSGLVKYPKQASRSPDGKIVIDYQEKTFEDRLDKARAMAAFDKVARSRVKSNQTYLQLSCHPTKSLSMPALVSVLKDWERDGWICDACVIDYSDLLAPHHPRDDPREAINNNWIAMRALAQTNHCLVATATQTKATSYYSDLIDRDHFADDRRKIDHCHACIGLCQTRDEKPRQILRLNFFALREDDYDERKCVTCVGCLAVANPFVRSLW